MARISFVTKEGNILGSWEGELSADGSAPSLLSMAISAGVYIEASCGGKTTCGKCKVDVEGVGSVLACTYHPSGDTLVTVPDYTASADRKTSLMWLPEDFTPDNPWSDSESATAYGFAFDIGTTTVAGALMEMSSGRLIASRAAENPQGVHGADVISRITYASGSPENLRELQALIAGGLTGMMDMMLAEAGVSPEKVRRIVCCGNTSMCHLLLGIDPSGLARAPFEPAYTGEITARAVDYGIGSEQIDSELYVMPCIAGHVGSDITADLLALSKRTEENALSSLMIDIGTNGEIYAHAAGRQLVCSTAAGPAFEGTGVSFGMRAKKGAIEKLQLDEASGDISIAIIGDEDEDSEARVQALGICGSGLIDALSVLFESGLMDKSGRIIKPAQIESAGISEALAERLEEYDGVRALRVADGIYLTQKDIRQLQLVKGAMSAGGKTLLSLLGLSPGELDAVYVAGAFGSHIDPASALTIGLLPDVELDKVIPIGNAAQTGAVIALLSDTARREARDMVKEIAGGGGHVELSADPGFQDLFMQELGF